MHQHMQTCEEELCLESKLFNSGLSQKNGILNNYEENLKKCSDFLIYLKKKLLSQVNVVCLESLNSVFISQMKIYAERTQFCQKFIQMIGLVHKVNPELTVRGLKIFYEDIKNQFILEERQLVNGSQALPQLRAFSMILEGVKKFGDIIETEKSFLFGSLVSTFSDDLLRGTTVIEKQTVYYVMKIILQLLQHKGPTTATTTTKTTTLVEPGGGVYWKCFCISMAILKTEDCTKDSQLIAASVVVELLKLLDGDLEWLKMVYICFCYLLGSLTLNGSSSLSMGSTVLCGALLAHSDTRKLTTTLVDLDYNRSELGFEPGSANTELPKICRFKVFVDSLDCGAEIEFVTTKALQLFIFEVAISSCRSSSHLHYQSLKLIQQWCQLLPSFYGHFSPRSSVKGMRDEVVSLITMHVESQIDGVDRNAVDALSSLLEAFQKISLTDADVREQFDSFKSCLYSRVLSFNWNIRSKYLLLGPLLDHVVPDLALDALMSDLRKCLSTNHLVPCSTSIYKKVVSAFRSNPGCLNIWTNHCCPHLINALTNSKSLERKNAAHYWLPSTLQIIPESLESMIFCLDHLESPKESSSSSSSSSPQSVHKEWMDVLNFLSTDVSTSSIVYARLRILWAARMAALDYDCPSRDLKFAFSSSSNDLRLAALNLICISPSTTDCPSEEDVSLLKQFMAFQLSADDPAFRKELEKCLRSICVRCRDHALMKIRVQQKNKKKLGNDIPDDKNVQLCLELMDFLWQTCTNSLSPNSNFQRLYSALTWMKIILGTFVSAPRQIRKGVVPVDVHLFLEAAREKHFCDFFTESCTTLLLCCIFNDVDQISEMSSEILQIYFPWPLKCEGLKTLGGPRITEKECIGLHKNDSVLHDDASLWLLKESLELCDNIRSRESLCGVVLGGLLFSRFIVEQQTAVKLCRSSNKIVGSMSDEVPSQLSRISCDLLFVEQLLDLLVGDFNEATSDIVNKAASHPLHGIISLMTTCFKRLPVIELDDGENEEKIKELVNRITNFCKNLVYSILDIFGGRLLNEATSPSFEQISRAISELIEASRGGSDAKEGELKTSDEEAARLHQFVSSWCWLNMKECGLLLGELMKYSERNASPIVGTEESEQVGQIFFKVLTQCRHRGAIESCTLGLLDFCSAAFHSSDKFIFNLPARLVDQVFDQLEALSDSSTTRRSAGLPSIIQTVLISEARCGQSIIMKRVIRRLLELCGTPQKNFHEQRDHPQVHGTNILKTLVHESCLSDAMSQFLEPIILSVLDGFNSDNWMIRNAALQLFGSMVPRMVGEKTSSDETTHATNSSEFLLRFPKLFRSVLDILIEETQNMRNSSNDFVDFCEKFLNPVIQRNSPSETHSPSHSLVPILSLLSRLAPSYHLSKQRSSQELSLCYLVQNLCQSSILMVRDLSSKVILSFVGGENLFDLLVSVVMLLPEEHARLSANRTHGLLLQLLKLHVAAAHCLTDDQMFSVRSLLKTKSHLLSSSCLLIRACFLKVMLLWDVQSEFVVENVERILSSDQFNGCEVGLAFYQQTLITVWLSETHDQCLLMKNIALCLKSTHSEIVQSCLEWIINFEDKISIEIKANVVSFLWELLDSNQLWFILCSVLKVLLQLYRYSHEISHSFNKAWMLLDNICKATIVPDDEGSSRRTAKSYTPSKLALELLSQIFSKALELNLLSDSEMMEKVLNWSSMVLWCSRCTKNVDLRSSAVKSCREVVPICFKIFAEHHHHNHLSSSWSVFFIRLLEAGLTFLTDDDAEIRSSAAEMISLVSTGESSDTSLPSSIHHEIAIRMWLEAMLNIAGTDHAMVEFLYKLIEENEAYKKLKSFQKNMFDLDDIFQAEDDNPYFEADQFHQIISISLLKKNPIPSREFVEDKVISLSNRIATVIKITSENRSLEIAFNKTLSSCLSSLCCQHLLLKLFLANIGADNNLDSAKSHLADAEKELELLTVAIFSLERKL